MNVFRCFKYINFVEENMYVKVLAIVYNWLAYIFYLLLFTYFNFIYDKTLMYSFKKPKRMGKQVFKAYFKKKHLFKGNTGG